MEPMDDEVGSCNASLDLFEDDLDESVLNSPLSSKNFTGLSESPSPVGSTNGGTDSTPLCQGSSASTLFSSSETESRHRSSPEPVCSRDKGQSLLLAQAKKLDSSDLSGFQQPVKRHKAQGHDCKSDPWPGKTDTVSQGGQFNYAEASQSTARVNSEKHTLSQNGECKIGKNLTRSVDVNHEGDIIDHSSEMVLNHVDERDVENSSDGATKIGDEGSDFSCPFCSAQETCLLLLEHHIFTAHPDFSEQAGAVSSADEEARLSNAFPFLCPLCDMDLETEPALASHLNVVHSEETVASSNDQNFIAGSLSCPLCDVSCRNEEEMASHVKTHEYDSTYYGVSTSEAVDPVNPNLCESSMVCPMCGQKMADADLLTSHVETHFSPQHRPGEMREPAAVNKENIPVASVRKPVAAASTKHSAGGSTRTTPLASQSSPRREQKARRTPPSSAFPSSSGTSASSVSANKGASSYRRQYERSLEQAVMKGAMSVADYHEQRAVLQGSDLRGVDDGHSRVDGLIEQLQRLYRQQARPGQRAYLCSPTSHFTGSHGDKGWGCGYRNFQMMLSCLAHRPEYSDRIFAGGRAVVPSVPKVQEMIESAWRKGFDQDGCRQLNGRLVNTQKWIGATEIVATLSSVGVRCRLVDFHAPSAPDGSHPRLLEWVRDYFTTRQPQQFTPPLYLQHQGHSRTIVGVEVDRGTTRLLLFDPGSKRDHLATLAATGLTWKCMRTFRRTQTAFKARQYQIVEVAGLLTGREYEESKIIKSERIS